MEPHTWPKEADAERFAKVLASYLDEGAAKGQFTDLVLVASPHFLGMVHNTLGKQTAKHLRTTVHHDLVMLDGAEIRRTAGRRLSGHIAVLREAPKSRFGPFATRATMGASPRDATAPARIAAGRSDGNPPAYAVPAPPRLFCAVDGVPRINAL